MKDMSALVAGRSLSEALAHHRLALGPKRLRVLRIKRVGTHAGEGEAFGVNGLCDVAILAIPAADLAGFPHDGRPDRGRGPLRDRLVREGLRSRSAR